MTDISDISEAARLAEARWDAWCSRWPWLSDLCDMVGGDSDQAAIAELLKLCIGQPQNLLEAMIDTIYAEALREGFIAGCQSVAEVAEVELVNIAKLSAAQITPEPEPPKSRKRK